jgi:uncharacterized protein (TIGR02246 family)
MSIRTAVLVGLAMTFSATLISARPRDIQDSYEKEALNAMIASFENAWSKCDGKGLAALWTPDGDFQSPYGFTASGRAGIAQFYSHAFAAGYCGSKGTGQIQAIRFVQHNIAIIDGTWSIQGARDSKGRQQPEEAGRFTAVATKTRHGWRIVAQREMIPVVFKASTVSAAMEPPGVRNRRYPEPPKMRAR